MIKGMRPFNYSLIKDQKWDSDMLGYIAAIYREAGKQEQYLKQRPEELEKLVEIIIDLKYSECGRHGSGLQSSARRGRFICRNYYFSRTISA